MTPAAPDEGTPLILVNPRAARLTDPLQRDRVVADVSGAVRRRYGRAPRIESGSLETARAALAESLDAPLVVVVGGDGSVREAAEALIGRGTPLAIVPGGTGNVLAGALGIRGVGPGVAAIRAGRTRVLDLGRARWGTRTSDPDRADESQERLFTVACGMGLDARIMAAAADEWKRRMRFGAYVGAALRELVRLESPGTGSWPTASPSRSTATSPSSRTPASSSPGGSGRASRSTRRTVDSTSSCSAAVHWPRCRARRPHGPVRATSRAASSAGGPRGADRGRSRPADRDRR